MLPEATTAKSDVATLAAEVAKLTNAVAVIKDCKSDATGLLAKLEVAQKALDKAQLVTANSPAVASASATALAASQAAAARHAALDYANS